VNLLQKGQIIQFERRGFFIVDRACSAGGEPIQLIFIPDGRSGSMSTLSQKVLYRLS
jgi:hypothetical protein